MAEPKLGKLSKGSFSKKWGKWTDDDIILLRKLFKVLTYKEISQLFGLSEQEVRGALSYRVKSKKLKKVVWDEDKIDYLRRYYGKISIEDLANSLGCSVAGVHHKASRLGIKPYTDEPFSNPERIWKIIDDYPNYEVSSDGLVRNINLNKLITPTIKNNYYRARLSKNGKLNSKTIHRLMAEAFLGEARGMEINHIDGNSLNNDLTNLEILDKESHKVHTRMLQKYIGNKVNTAVLTPEKVSEMRKMYNRGDISYSQIAKIYGVNKSTARRAIVGESWSHLQ